MDVPRLRGETDSVLRQSSRVPLAVVAVGVLVLLVALWQAVVAVLDGVGLLQVSLDLLFVGTPGVVLVYTGLWMPGSEISPEHYRRIVAWVLGGVGVMYLFILLRDAHPGVTVEWSIGTQAIALTIGSIGGLLIGVQETRATVRADRLEEYTAELQERERELERQNEQLERFASVLSHDLRNPLSVATGRLELAREERESAHLDTVADAHARIEALIDDLLTLARQGDSISDPEPVDVGTLSERCWQNVSTDGATISVADDTPIQADPDRLRQLLENLFRNAVEHGSTSNRTESGDAVERGDAPTVTVGELADGSGFYVADDGPGIPEGERDDVFESGYSTTQSGTGFGLAIVEEIAHAHGWEVRVTESADGGARFEVTGVDSGVED